jgi:triosephosphate isomerase
MPTNRFGHRYGRNATPEQANEMCGHIRKVIEELYGDEVSEKGSSSTAAA